MRTSVGLDHGTVVVELQRWVTTDLRIPFCQLSAILAHDTHLKHGPVTREAHLELAAQLVGVGAIDVRDHDVLVSLSTIRPSMLALHWMDMIRLYCEDVHCSVAETMKATLAVALRRYHCPCIYGASHAEDDAP